MAGMHKVLMVIGTLAATASTPVRAQNPAAALLPRFEVASLKESAQRTQARTHQTRCPTRHRRRECRPSIPMGPTFFTALQEQLGLKIQSGKAPLPVVVIDSIEHPTPD